MDIDHKTDDMKRGSTPLVTGNTQIETKMKYHYVSTSMLKKKMPVILNLDKHVKQVEFLYIAFGTVKCYRHFCWLFLFSNNAKHTSTSIHDPAAHSQDAYSREVKTYVHEKTGTLMPCLIHSRWKLDIDQCSCTKDDEIVVCSHSEYN